MARTAVSKADVLKESPFEARARLARERMSSFSQLTYSQLTADDKEFLLKYFLEINSIIKPE